MTNGHCITRKPIGLSLPHWKPPALPPREPMEGHWCRLERLDPNEHAEGLLNALAADSEGIVWTYLAYGPFSSAASYRAWMSDHCLGNDPLFFARNRESTSQRRRLEPFRSSIGSGFSTGAMRFVPSPIFIAAGGGR
jgi:hypothetical protein